MAFKALAIFFRVYLPTSTVTVPDMSHMTHQKFCKHCSLDQIVINQNFESSVV